MSGGITFRRDPEKRPGIQLRDSAGISPASLLTPAPQQRTGRCQRVVETSAQRYSILRANISAH
jgi:hypothetical protein